MKLKFTVKLVGMKDLVSNKTASQMRRAVSIARTRVVPLVVDRALQLVQKQSPDMEQRYKKALSARGAVEITDKGIVINVTDPLVLANEKGSKAFDMKPKLLARAKKSSKGGGAYVDVVFRHKSSEIPAAVRNKMAKASKMSGGGDVTHVSNTPGKSFTRQLQRGGIGQRLGLKPKKQQVQHQRGIHDDLMRKAKPGSRSGSYMTIRRVSTNSAASSWWHPGFKAQRIIEKVLPSIKRDVSAILRDAIIQARGG